MSIAPKPVNPAAGRDPATPAPVLRARAIALPAAAFVLGLAAPARRGSALLVATAAATVPVVAGALVRASRRDEPVVTGSAAGAAGPAAPMPVIVVVPARDEAPVIGALVADLAAAARRAGAAGSGPHDGPHAPTELVIVDDASTDGTGDVAAAALEAAAPCLHGRIVRLAAPSGSKGRALALAGLLTHPDAVLVVLDADARVRPDFLERCREVAASGAPVAQARRRALAPALAAVLTPAPGSLPPGVLRPALTRVLARLQDDELAIDDVIQRGRLALGGATELRGDGMLLRPAALELLGGWPCDALCEDLEMSTRWFARTGRGVARPAGLEVWEQPVLDVRSLLVQRLRWAEGSIRRDLGVAWPAVLDRRAPARRRLDLGLYAAHALVPWFVLGIAVQATGRGGGRLQPARGRARRVLGALAAGYGAGAAVLAWEAIGREVGGPRRVRVARVAAAIAFGGGCSVVLPLAWLRLASRPGAPRFDRTVHAPADAFEPPERPSGS